MRNNIKSMVYDISNLKFFLFMYYDFVVINCIVQGGYLLIYYLYRIREFVASNTILHFNYYIHVSNN